MVCAAVIAVCVTRTHRRRPWDALLVALAPAFALTATINWDLLAVALTAAAMLMWSREPPARLRRPARAGHGRQALSRPAAGAAARAVLARGQWRAFGTALRRRGRRLARREPAGDAALACEGWSKFYTFSQERRRRLRLVLADHLPAHRQPARTDRQHVATLLMLLACAGIAALALTRPAPAALRPAGVPGRRGVHPHQQGLLAAVRAVADPARRPGPAEVAGLPDLAGVRGDVLPRHLAVPRVHGQRRQHQGLPPEGYQLAIARTCSARCTCAR